MTEEITNSFTNPQALINGFQTNGMIKVRILLVREQLTSEREVHRCYSYDARIFF